MEVNFTVMCFWGVFTYCQTRNLVPFVFLLWTLWNTMNVIKSNFLYKGCIPFAVGVAWMYSLSFGGGKCLVLKWFKQQYIRKYIIQGNLQKPVEMRANEMLLNYRVWKLPCPSAVVSSENAVPCVWHATMLPFPELTFVTLSRDRKSVV